MGHPESSIIASAVNISCTENSRYFPQWLVFILEFLGYILEVIGYIGHGVFQGSLNDQPNGYRSAVLAPKRRVVRRRLIPSRT